MAKPLKYLKILPSEQSLAFDGQPTVLEVLLENELPINHSCEGMGTCGTCMISVQKGLEQMGPANFVEQEILTDRKCSPKERLACQNIAFDGLEIEIPYEEV